MYLGPFLEKTHIIVLAGYVLELNRLLKFLTMFTRMRKISLSLLYVGNKAWEVYECSSCYSVNDDFYMYLYDI